MICKQCGRELPDHAVYCRYCGARITQEEKTKSPAPAKKKRSALPVVIVLALVLLACLFFYLRSCSRGNEPAPAPEEPAVSEPVQDPEPSPEPATPVDYVLHIEGDDNIEAGKNVVLKAVISPDATLKRIVWTSSDESVATITDGIINAESAGETTIRCLAALEDNQILEAELPFRVLPKPVTYTVKLDPEQLELTAGSAESFDVVIEAQPEGEDTSSEITWESTDTMVAAVTDGRVQAVGEGSARIIANVKLPDGSVQKLTGSVKVTPAVTSQAPVSSNTTASQNTPSSAPAPAPAPAPATASFQPEGSAPEKSADYVMANSSTTLLSVNAMLKMSDEELRLGRNEIYARHGRKFDTDWIQNYFDGKSWYQGTIAPADFDPNVLSDLEKANVYRILYAEDHN